MVEHNAKLAHLKGTVVWLRAFLEQRIQSKEADEANLKAHVQIHEEELKKTLKQLDKIDGWLADHDTPDDDVLIGRAEFDHKRAFHRLTPSFRFDIRTEFPIRRVDDSDKPASSKWLPEERRFQEGGKSFAAVLKNKRTSSATASIQLFGRRNEVHATEISNERARQKSLAAHGVEQIEKINCSQNELGRFQRTAVHYHEHHQFTSRDLARLEKSNKEAQQEENTFVLSHILGLKSVVWKEHVLPAHIRDKLISPRGAQLMKGQQAAQNELVCYLQKLNTNAGAHGQEIGWMHGDLIGSRIELQRLSKRENRRQVAVLEGLAHAQAQCRSPQGDKLLQNAQNALEADNKEVEGIFCGAISELDIQSTLIAADRGFTEARSQIEEMYMQSFTDLRATIKVLSLMQDQEHSWPIGVYACFAGGSSPEDGWTEVWKGERMLFAKK